MVLGSADYRCSFFRFKLFVLHEYRLLKDNKLLCADRPPDDHGLLFAASLQYSALLFFTVLMEKNTVGVLEERVCI